MFGSNIKHQNFISLRIFKSEKCFDEYSERYYPREQLIDIEMSAVQFSEAITTLNYGSGVPITLRFVGGEMMPECPEVNQVEKINLDAKDKIQEVAEQLVKYKQEADELLTKKGALLKNEREKLKGNLSHIFQQINSNLPFLHQCMQEAVDNTVSQAKGEVDSYLTSAISNLGIEAFQKLNLPTDSDQVLIDISEKEE